MILDGMAVASRWKSKDGFGPISVVRCSLANARNQSGPEVRLNLTSDRSRPSPSCDLRKGCLRTAKRMSEK